MRWRARVLALVAVLACVASPVAAQGDAWARLFPEGADLGPPEWVRPGTRITFGLAGASVPQTRGDDARGASGAGASEMDIVAIDGTDVLVSWVAYQWNPETDSRMYVPKLGFRSMGAAVDDVLLHPTLLAGMLEGAGPQGLDAIRGPYKLGETTYDAIRVTTSTTSFTFDSVSGRLLVKTTGTATGGVAPNSEGGLQQLMGSRNRDVPGIGAPVPGWLRPGTVLTYQESWVETRAQQEAPAQMELRFDEVGRDWASVLATFRFLVAGQPMQDGHSAMAGGAGPYWYSPDALMGMRPGDVLDEDPITYARTTVAGVGPGPNGTLVTIIMEMPGSRLETAYDQASGKLLVYDLTLADMFSRVRVELVGQP